MKVIARLVLLREEIEEIDRDLNELAAKKAQLEEALTQAQEATDKNLIERFRAGEPIRVADIDTKTKNLAGELRVVVATLEAMGQHKGILEEEREPLEASQKEAEGWHSVALPFIASKVLRGQLRGVVDQAVESARPEVSQNVLGYDVVKKSIPRSTGGSLSYYIGQLEHDVLRAARRVDPRFPEVGSVDLSMVDQGWGRDNRASSRSDRRILPAIWEAFLNVQARFMDEFGIDIGPDEQEINETIKQAIPSPPKRPYH